jgi:hypothetical protein
LSHHEDVDGVVRLHGESMTFVQALCRAPTQDVQTDGHAVGIAVPQDGLQDG